MIELSPQAKAALAQNNATFATEFMAGQKNNSGEQVYRVRVLHKLTKAVIVEVSEVGEQKAVDAAIQQLPGYGEAVAAEMTENERALKSALDAQRKELDQLRAIVLGKAQATSSAELASADGAKGPAESQSAEPTPPPAKNTNSKGKIKLTAGPANPVRPGMSMEELEAATRTPVNKVRDDE